MLCKNLTLKTFEQVLYCKQLEFQNLHMVSNNQDGYPKEAGRLKIYFNSPSGNSSGNWWGQRFLRPISLDPFQHFWFCKVFKLCINFLKRVENKGELRKYLELSSNHGLPGFIDQSLLEIVKATFLRTTFSWPFSAFLNLESVPTLYKFVVEGWKWRWI